jgi:hypothetical protein
VARVEERLAIYFVRAAVIRNLRLA